jgi:ferredoxin
VIVSIGQTGALDWIRPEDELRATGRGTLEVNPATLATSAPGVFAGGDIAFGPRLIVNAVADGQKAARGIHAYLQGQPPRLIRRGYFTPIPRHMYPALGPARGFLRRARQAPPLLPVERRIGVTQVELAYDETTARAQGARCLICSLNPVFDGDLCILCNGCVDVCPTDCLKLVPVSDIGGDEPLAALVGEREARTAMLLDPTRCIRCGLCAARCPTEAVRMESFRFTEELSFAGHSSDS